MSPEIIIGLEVHVELLTESKLFCGCSTKFGNPPNTNVCPVCLGLPGVLPVLNRKAVEHLIRTACALSCTIAPRSKFDRKNYFYPDMPKNFQISQYDLPLATAGKLSIVTAGGEKTITIKRIHLEEDTGKSVHKGTIDCSLSTLEDYNRAGVPLLEIVTEPDMRSPEEAHVFLTGLKDILRWLAVSDCKMEEGSLRCDANISLSPGDGVLGTKTEIKNLNSFKSVREALEHEAARQQKCLASGIAIVQETRGWDEKKSVTIPMRSKEAEYDYRYFPEPDLLPLEPGAQWIREFREALPELPAEKRERFVRDYRIPSYDSSVLTSSPAMADFFEATVRCGASPKAGSNWLMGDISRILNDKSLSLDETPLTPGRLAGMIDLVEKGTVSGKTAKSLIEEMLATGKDPLEIVKERGLTQISGEDAIQALVIEVAQANTEAMHSLRKGNEKVRGFLVGQVMKASKGRANPSMVNKVLDGLLGALPLPEARQDEDDHIRG
ncbi:MAG: Asp-tRNA(Asn)/Glu-tRNA(Gln) amidotransferase subunit GatB [Candidatus Eremiobacteraeota bacterium]|nr:Asp-tRNA(Asn)/Glu-tRNA(Gln) amidotransferase subunit GatB [Candidatus Eremiobacteraeota bacterium]